MHVGILTQWYPPEPAPLPATLAQGLRDRGHRVTVLTGFPNYPYGRVYPGYEQAIHKVEQQEGVTVHRVPLYPSHDRSAARRVGNFASFAASSSTIGARALAGVDVVYVYHPPATAAALAVFKGLLGRTPFLLHVQDLWPDSVIEAGMIREGPTARAVGRGLDALCNFLYRRAGSIAVISDGMRQVLIERGVPREKVFRVYNWTDESIFFPRAWDRPPDEPTTVLFAGNFGAYQALDVAIAAAVDVGARTPFRLRLIGSGTEDSRLRTLAERLGSDSVEFCDRVPLEQAGDISSRADAHLVTLRDLPMFHVTIPGKTQAALASGKPIVVAAPGEVGRLIEDSRAGFRARPEDAADLARVFQELAACKSDSRFAMGERARRLYDSQMSESAGVNALETALRHLSRSTRG